MYCQSPKQNDDTIDALIMNKRQTQKLETRKKIRETAKQLFTVQGFEATTSRQIAQQADVATGTIFVHFPNKTAILVDILYEDIEATVQKAFQTLPTKQPTAIKLRHIAGTLYAYYLQHIELSRVLVRYSLLGPTDDGDDDFSEQIDAFIVAITALLQAGQTSGDVTQAKDSGAMAHAFYPLTFSC